MKKYTKVNYKKLWDEIQKFQEYCLELTENEPDACSEVWQIAGGMANKLLNIKGRAIILEGYNKKNIK